MIHIARPGSCSTVLIYGPYFSFHTSLFCVVINVLIKKPTRYNFVTLELRSTFNHKSVITVLSINVAHGGVKSFLLTYTVPHTNSMKHSKGKAVPLQAWTGPGGSRKLRFPNFVTTAQDGGRLSAFRMAAFTLMNFFWYSFLLEAESTRELYCDRKTFL